MKRKVLFCATIDHHFIKFHLPYLKWFKEQGWEVHVAAFGNTEIPFTDQKHHIRVQRSPLNLKNLLAYQELKAIIAANRYQIVHCHTPMGGVLARLAARQFRKSGTAVIYTAHGFHFCKGAPVFNWLVYYPIEKMLARFTDCLITINTEDFMLGARHPFNTECFEHVHGIGVDTERFKPVTDQQKIELRKKLRYRLDDFLMFYAAEFNSNKNHRLLIEAMAIVKHNMPNARLILAGDGPLLKECQALAESRGVSSMIDFLGYQNTIDPYLKLADLAVSSSRREGLPVNVMEAMASGLPILASQNRGHTELVQNEINGYIVPLNNIELFAERMFQLYRSKELCEHMGTESVNRIQTYSLERVRLEMNAIYTRYMAENRVQVPREAAR